MPVNLNIPHNKCGVTYSTAYGFLLSCLVFRSMPASYCMKDQPNNFGVASLLRYEIREAFQMVPVEPQSLQLLSVQFKMCISQAELVGKNFHIPVFIWAGFRYVSTCKATCPCTIGAMQGHLQEDGSDNYKCPEQFLQVIILHSQESDLT